MEAAAERACRAIGYENAGTFEFLLGPDGTFHFIELNARLQVEHPVSELVTGIDVVREQLRIAAGEPLSVTGRAPRRGHALEFRLNAEDPARDFAPAPGRITRFRPPLGPGVRVDTFLEEGSAISPYYDSLIAKLIVWAEDRDAAIARGIRALEELELEGIPTTRALALDVLRSPEFRSGEYSTSFLADVEERLPALMPAMTHDGHTIESAEGSVRITGEALAGLVVAAAEQVGGAQVRRPRRDLNVVVKDGRAHVKLELAARFGAVLPALGEAVQRAVAECGRRRDRTRGRRRRRRDRGARPMTATVGRRQARRTALFLLYQWDLTGQPLDDAVRGHARRVRASSSRRPCRRERRSWTYGSPRPPRAGPPIGSVRSSGTSCGSRSTSSTARPCRPRWRSTRRSCWRSATRPRTPRGS